jgi:hypothetical protein
MWPVEENRSQSRENFGIDKFYKFRRLNEIEEVDMADISHLPASRHVQRTVSPSTHSGLASLTAHAVFAAAIVFAVAIVLGFVN